MRWRKNRFGGLYKTRSMSGVELNLVEFRRNKWVGYYDETRMLEEHNSAEEAQQFVEEYAHEKEDEQCDL